jgi:D-alanyl-D-alanine carboxypeptidase (penicillin-binding protein 5/6)
MGEPSESARDTESLTLLRYGLDRFVRVRPVRAGRVLERAAVKHFDDRRVALRAARDARLTVRRGTKVDVRVDAPAELEGPLPKGHRAGTVVVLVAGRVAARVPLLTGSSVPEADLVDRAGGLFGWAIAFLVAGAALFAAVRFRALRSRGEGEVKT